MKVHAAFWILLPPVIEALHATWLACLLRIGGRLPRFVTTDPYIQNFYTSTSTTLYFMLNSRRIAQYHRQTQLNFLLQRPQLQILFPQTLLSKHPQPKFLPSCESPSSTHLKQLCLSLININDGNTGQAPLYGKNSNFKVNSTIKFGRQRKSSNLMQHKLTAYCYNIVPSIKLPK